MHDSQADVISVELDESRIEGDKTAIDETEDHTHSSAEKESSMVEDESHRLIPINQDSS